MSGLVEEWLPDQAMTPERVAAGLALPLEKWGLSWCTRRQPCISLTEKPLAFSNVSDGALDFEAGAVKLHLLAMGKRNLIEAILNEPLMGKDIKVSDHKLLDALARRASQDLVDRLASSLQSATASPGQRPRTFGLIFAGEEFGVLIMPLSSLAGLIKSGLPQSTALPRSAPVDRKKAIRHCEVGVEVMVGSVEVTINELNGLEPGDILVLDQPLDKPLPMRLQATAEVLGRGKLASRDGCNAITWQS